MEEASNTSIKKHCTKQEALITVEMMQCSENSTVDLMSTHMQHKIFMPSLTHTHTGEHTFLLLGTWIIRLHRCLERKL